MGHRKIEMHEFRNVLIRLRAGDRDREVARLGLMGRVKVAQFRALALSLGWLEPNAPLPDVPTIAQSLATKPKHATSTVSKAQPWREAVTRWMAAGVEGKAIHAALVREHQFQGSYSSVYRLMQDIQQELPRTDLTVRLSFKPGRHAEGHRSETVERHLGSHLQQGLQRKLPNPEWIRSSHPYHTGAV
jgi:hypothetical protein